MRQVIFDFGKLHILDSQFMLRIYGYGLMLVLGFLVSMSLAKWRARRMGENPDVITHVSLLALVCGVLGARIAYMIQWWDTQFANTPNPLLAMLDITSGGLTYYGGLGLGIGAVLVYLAVKRLPIRRYLDILAPSIMLGLAFGRMGCLLNGCCYGGMCAETDPLAMHFPMYSKPLIKLDGSSNPYSRGTDSPSPAYEVQLRQGLVHPPRQLCVINFGSKAQAGDEPVRLHVPRYLHGALTNDQLSVVLGTEDNARKEFAGIAPTNRLNEAQWEQALRSAQDALKGGEFWDEAVRFVPTTSHDASGAPVMDFDAFWNYCLARRQWLVETFGHGGGDGLSAQETQAANKYLQADLIALAEAQHALALRPSQALSAAGAALLALLLAWFTRLRKREGQVFALMMTAYPVFRFFEELIRADNPHNLSLHWSQLILTHNQYTSLVMFLIGIVMFLALLRLSPSCGPAWAQRSTGGTGNQRKNQPTFRRSLK